MPTQWRHHAAWQRVQPTPAGPAAQLHQLLQPDGRAEVLRRGPVHPDQLRSPESASEALFRDR